MSGAALDGARARTAGSACARKLRKYFLKRQSRGAVRRVHSVKHMHDQRQAQREAAARSSGTLASNRRIRASLSSKKPSSARCSPLQNTSFDGGSTCTTHLQPQYIISSMSALRPSPVWTRDVHCMLIQLLEALFWHPPVLSCHKSDSIRPALVSLFSLPHIYTVYIHTVCRKTRRV